MPIFGINNLKLLVCSEDKSRGITIEYPKDMGVGEILDRVTEFRNNLVTAIEKEKTPEEKKDDQAQGEDQKRG